MDNRRLIINGTNIPLMEGEAIPLTRSIIDIARPWERESDYTKNFLIPASKEANDIFSHIFEINIDTSYDPNLKLPAKYIEGSETILDGSVRLLDIKETDDEERYYEIQLIGSISNIFREFGEKELDDTGMLWDELDHTFDRTRQQNSWATSYQLNGSPTAYTLGSGYVYGLIDYGTSSNVTNYDVTDFRPQPFARETLLRMFNDAGFTWNSTFLDSTTFKKCVITSNSSSELGINSTQVTARLFEANTPLFVTSGLNTLSVAQSTNVYNYSNYAIRHTVEVVDPAGAHNTTTGEWIPPNNGWYNIIADMDLTATLTPTGASNTTVMNGSLKVVVSIQRKVSGGSYTTLNNRTIFISSDNIPTIGKTTTGTTYPDDNYSDSLQTITYAGALTTFNSTARNYNAPKTVNVTLNNQYLNSTDKIRISVGVVWVRDKLYDGNNTLFSSSQGWFIDETDNTVTHDGTVTLNLGSATFKNAVSNPILTDGASLDFYQVVPKKVKQRDFFKGLINAFNLFIEPDPDDPTILNIEPRNDFYNNDITDWSEKYAIDREKVTRPMGAVESRFYLYTYKPDKDYWNVRYSDEYDGKVYAERDFEIDNDFEKNTAKTELTFSATPSTGFTNSDRVIPQIIKFDGQNKNSIDANIRLLFYGGLISTNQNWNHTSLGTDDFQSSYPYVGMWDDPFNPTETLDFGTPRKIYWNNTFQTVNATDNNLFNKYYLQYIQEIIDKNSKTVTAYFALTANDVKTADFRTLFRWDNAYFRLNRIIDYKAGELTKCEFLKLNYADPFVLNIIELINGKNEVNNQDEPLPIFDSYTQKNGNNFNDKSGTVDGYDNIVDPSAENISIQGDNNTIGVNTKNITIQGGDNNQIIGGAENVTLINTSDTIILESNVTYIDGIAQSGATVVDQKSANFTASLDVTTYEVDTSGGNITVTLPADGTPEGKVWIIKKIHASNTITVQSEKGYTIDLATNGTITTYNAGIQFQFNGDTNFNSI